MHSSESMKTVGGTKVRVLELVTRKESVPPSPQKGTAHCRL